MRYGSMTSMFWLYISSSCSESLRAMTGQQIEPKEHKVLLPDV